MGTQNLGLSGMLPSDFGIYNGDVVAIPPDRRCWALLQFIKTYTANKIITSSSSQRTTIKNMHANILFTAASSLFAVAQAVSQPPTPVIAARQSVVTPPPCEAIDPPPSAAETEERFNEFADAFLVEKNLTHAFEFISSTYIVSLFSALREICKRVLTETCAEPQSRRHRERPQCRVGCPWARLGKC